jgi:hypothetical protein
MRLLLRQFPIPVLLIWAVLGFELVVALWQGRLSLAFIAFATFGLSLLPLFFARRFGLKLPTSFLVAIAVFTFATIYLGEAFDFYNRYWWWDLVLHSGSALGFGLIGFLFMFMMFEGDRYAAPPSAIAFFAFCFAMTIGAMWEIFEFGMDQLFGLNMQKSGLVDTMWDFIVNMVGAMIGAAAGFFYLKGWPAGGLGMPIAEFIRINRRLFRKSERPDR